MGKARHALAGGFDNRTTGSQRLNNRRRDCAV